MLSNGALDFFNWQAQPKLPRRSGEWNAERNHRLFVAYLREDRDVATALRIYLEGYGYHVYMYKPEQPWSDPTGAIAERIQESFVLILLENNNRPSTWLAAELEYAQAKLIPVIRTKGAKDLWQELPTNLRKMSSDSVIGRARRYMYENTFKLFAKGIVLLHAILILAFGFLISRLFSLTLLAGACWASFPLVVLTPLLAHHLGESFMVILKRGRYIDLIGEQLNEASLLSRIFEESLDGTTSPAVQALEDDSWENWDVMVNPFRAHPGMPGDVIFGTGIGVALLSPFVLLLTFGIWSLVTIVFYRS